MPASLGFFTDSCHNGRDGTCYQHNPVADRTMMEHRMAKANLPTPEELRKLLDYDPETGALTWRPRPVSMFSDGKHSAARKAERWNTRYAGKPAFTGMNNHRYLRGAIFNALYKAHRVAWALHYGEWPVGEIDHENGRRDDNRIENLRVVNGAENRRNQKRRRDNSSGTPGVYLDRRRGKWRANIGQKYIGTFSDFEAAASARKAAEREFGFHENHGRAE